MSWFLREPADSWDYFARYERYHLIRRSNPEDKEYFERSFGSYDVMKLMGVNPYKGGTPLDLYMEKKEIVPGFEGNERMQLGLALEEAIFNHWRDTNEVINDNYRLEYNRLGISVVNVDYNYWIHGTPDAFIWDRRERKPVGLIDIKNVGEYSADKWKDGVPAMYELQMQLYLHMLELSKGYVVACFGGNRVKEYVVYPAKPNDPHIWSIAIHNFVSSLENDQPPFDLHMDHEHYKLAYNKWHEIEETEEPVKEMDMENHFDDALATIKELKASKARERESKNVILRFMVENEYKRLIFSKDSAYNKATLVNAKAGPYVKLT